jgi:hypothetical protein
MKYFVAFIAFFIIMLTLGFFPALILTFAGSFVYGMLQPETK